MCCCSVHQRVIVGHTALPQSWLGCACETPFPRKKGLHRMFVATRCCQMDRAHAQHGLPRKVPYFLLPNERQPSRLADTVFRCFQDTGGKRQVLLAMMDVSQTA